MWKLGSLAFAAAMMMAIPHPGSAQTAEETNIKLIKDYYAAYATGDPEALRPFLADGPVD